MRQFIFTIVLVSIVIGNILNAQTVPDSIYYKRLYYTGKVWGFVKYFHSEVAKGNINWDRELMETLRNVKDNVSNQDFTNSLLSMLEMAGEMAIPASPLPELHDSLKYNLDLNWLHDTIFSDDIVAKLDTINTKFRPQSNFFVGEAYKNGNPTFYNDSQFYVWAGDPYPIEEFRLLILLETSFIISFISL